MCHGLWKGHNWRSPKYFSQWRVHIHIRPQVSNRLFTKYSLSSFDGTMKAENCLRFQFLHDKHRDSFLAALRRKAIFRVDHIIILALSSAGLPWIRDGSYSVCVLLSLIPNVALNIFSQRLSVHVQSGDAVVLGHLVALSFCTICF